MSLFFNRFLVVFILYWIEFLFQKKPLFCFVAIRRMKIVKFSLLVTTPTKELIRSTGLLFFVDKITIKFVAAYNFYVKDYVFVRADTQCTHIGLPLQ